MKSPNASGRPRTSRISSGSRACPIGRRRAFCQNFPPRSRRRERRSRLAPRLARGRKARSAETQVTLAQRARRELIEYFVVSSYLFVCFGALIFYKASILHGEGIEFTVFGLAIVKALILGKFLLLLEALKIGEDKKHARSALANILTKSLLFSLLLFAMTVVEELIVGHIHGRTSRRGLKGDRRRHVAASRRGGHPSLSDFDSLFRLSGSRRPSRQGKTLETSHRAPSAGRSGVAFGVGSGASCR